MTVAVVKSKNGAISLEGDSDGIASVIEELMEFVLEKKDRAASQREAELLAKQVCVAFSLTFSPPIPLRLYALPYWSNPPFLFLTFGRSGGQN